MRRQEYSYILQRSQHEAAVLMFRSGGIMRILLSSWCERWSTRLTWLGAVTIASLSVVILGTRSASAEAPDVGRYCQTYFGTMYSTQSLTVAGRTTHVCFAPVAGLGPLRHVDFAEACRLTNGSDDFRYVDGFVIDCSREQRRYISESPNTYILQPEDLEKYCAEALGPGAVPIYSEELKRAVCTGSSAAPGPNPLTINFSYACQLAFGTDKVRYVNGGKIDFVACLK